MEFGNLDLALFSLLMDISLSPSVRQSSSGWLGKPWGAYRIMLFLSTFGCSSISESSDS